MLTQNAGQFESEEMALRALRGRIRGGIWVQWHFGSPGLSGTQDVISGVGRAGIAEGEWE